jgi:hypothetical protein
MYGGTYHQYSTSIHVVYNDNVEQDFQSQAYATNATFNITECQLIKLPFLVNMKYYNSVCCYNQLTICPLTDPGDSFNGCCHEAELQAEIDEKSKPVYEEHNGTQYRVIAEEVNNPIRKCWCTFVRDIVNTGKAIIHFEMNEKKDAHSSNYNMIVKGKLEDGQIVDKSKTFLWPDLSVALEISFETTYANKYSNAADLIYFDDEANEYLKVRLWNKYTLSSVIMKITVTRLPIQFIISLSDMTVRTTGFVDCHSKGPVNIEMQCTNQIPECWCTAVNSLRSKGTCQITVPMRLVWSKSHYNSENYDFWLTIEGEVNKIDKNKIDLILKPDFKYKHSMTTRYDYD